MSNCENWQKLTWLCHCCLSIVLPALFIGHSALHAAGESQATVYHSPFFREKYTQEIYSPKCSKKLQLQLKVLEGKTVQKHKKIKIKTTTA